MCHTRLEKQLWEQSVGKLFSVPNEIISILVTRFLGNEW